MNHQQSDDPSVFALSRFQGHVADFRRTLNQLQQSEQGMAQALAQMKAQGHPRERLLIAEIMLDDLRGILRASSPYVKLKRAFSPTSEADVNVV